MRHASLLPLVLCALGCPEHVDPSEVGEAPRVRAPDAAAQSTSTEPPAVRVEKAGGLVVEVAEHGTGRLVREGDRVEMHCVGTLAATGAVFATSATSGIPLSLWLRRDSVIPGLVRGLDGLHVGARAKLFIPSALAYGEAGLASAGIPASADLVYEVHVIHATDRMERR